MTDLTEKWKNGELSCGWYYIKIADIVFIDFFEGKVWKNKKDKYIDKVLAQVPSYNEYEQLKGYNEYLRNIIIECEPYIENVCTVLNMEKFANVGFLHKSNEVLSKIRTVIGEKK